MATVQGLNVGALNTATASNPLGGTAAVRTGQEYSLGGSPKVGATAGWVVNAAADIFQATLPASQTGSTLVIPIFGLKVGWTITAFRCVMQIESGGNSVAVDCSLRAQTNVAADPTDALIGAATQLAVTADTAASITKTGLTETVVSTKSYYLLIAVTNGASTDIRYLGSWLTVTEV